VYTEDLDDVHAVRQTPAGWDVENNVVPPVHARADQVARPLSAARVAACTAALVAVGAPAGPRAHTKPIVLVGVRRVAPRRADNRCASRWDEQIGACWKNVLLSNQSCDVVVVHRAEHGAGVDQRIARGVGQIGRAMHAVVVLGGVRAHVVDRDAAHDADQAHVAFRARRVQVIAGDHDVFAARPSAGPTTPNTCAPGLAAHDRDAASVDLERNFG